MNIKTIIIAILLALTAGCVGLRVHLGIASRDEMMIKWKGMSGVALLDDINRWGNWYPKDTSMEYGQCVDMADAKESVLKELGIPYKRMNCVIEREWGRPFGHAFLVAQLNGGDYIMDNGAVQDVVWAYEPAIKSTYGIIAIEEW